MQGAVVHLAERGARIIPSPPLPLEALLIGRPVEDAAQMLPRLFNLCRMAQGTAALLALGLPGAEDPTPEILRDHAARIFATLRQAFGLAPLPPPPLTAHHLFGPMGALPRTLADLMDWTASDQSIPLILREIGTLFPPHVATAPVLPAPPSPLAEGAYENSAAGRQTTHPLLQAVEARQGRGPLWRYLGLLADAEAALAGRLAQPELHEDIAVVQAARGAYALRLTQAEGRLTGLARRTPTDHLLAPGGALEQALSRCHPSLAPIVIALHDPCVPVTIKEASHA